MRKIKTFTLEDGERSVVYLNSEWNEYVVRWYNKDGVHMDASDYHTSDKQDAIDTARPTDDLLEYQINPHYTETDH